MDAEVRIQRGRHAQPVHEVGTTIFHGTTYYFGRNPVLNALANRITRGREHHQTEHLGWHHRQSHQEKTSCLTSSRTSSGGPTQPSSKVQTVPTDAERTGDFSGSLTPQGNLRPIFDPFTTVFDPNASTVTRQPFAGKHHSQGSYGSRRSEGARRSGKPNNPGDDLSA